uniref:CCHC-type domain-containing protein n=1 Tax=Setaria italica TaxID=4555 RepID=K3ZCJ0_SETIT
PKSVPLCGSDSAKWSTLGGDSRSFVQVLKSKPIHHQQMDDRGSFGARRAPRGGGRIWRGCGKIGHRSRNCFKSLVCGRCKKEGHVPRACPEFMPWECIAAFCGLAASGQGFHIIQDEDYGENSKDMANCAPITITGGSVIARHLEGEFKAQAGPSSPWRWYAKKLADNKFQMKFPLAKKVEELAFFTGIQMRTWNPHVGAKAELSAAWFRIFGIPPGKRIERKACYIGSLVGIPLEVDRLNLKRWEYVRVKIGCRNVSKVPAIVEGLLDLHFYDFTFQREVPTEGITNLAGNGSDTVAVIPAENPKMTEANAPGTTVLPSPETGTQEAPVPIWSSQEDQVLEELVVEGKSTLVEKEMSKAEATDELIVADSLGQLRQSDQIKKQGVRGIKIADKAELATKKKNLDVNHLSSQKSFAVLYNNELMLRSSKMGVNINSIDLEQFDVLKDMERDRANLNERNKCTL